MPNPVTVNIDYVCEMLIDGKTYRQISEMLTVSLTTLHNFCAQSEHSARVREALNISADHYADKAEQVLLDLTKTSNMAEISRARELSQFYKWKAAKRRPKEFGEKIDLTTQGDKITTFNVGYERPKD